MSGAQFGPLWSELSVKLSQKSLDVLDKLGFERAAPVQVGAMKRVAVAPRAAAIASLCAHAAKVDSRLCL